MTPDPKAEPGTFRTGLGYGDWRDYLVLGLLATAAAGAAVYCFWQSFWEWWRS